MKLNPNHPVTQLLDDEFFHKLCAVLVMKPVAHDRHFELTLLRESHAMEIARKEGGLPQ